LVARLQLTSVKIESLLKGIDCLVNMSKVNGKLLESRQIPHPFQPNQQLVWSRHQIPLGLVLVIFESRPDVLVQLLALAIRSGNGMVLKGGREASNTLQALFQVFLEATPPQYQQGFSLLLNRDDTKIALSRPEFSLVIPRGGESFVDYVRQNSVAPVIGHGSGICYAYLHSDVDLRSDWVVDIIKHAKLDYPAACNALEVLLLPLITFKKFRDQLVQFLVALINSGIHISVTSKLEKWLHNEAIYTPSDN